MPSEVSARTCLRYQDFVADGVINGSDVGVIDWRRPSAVLTDDIFKRDKDDADRASLPV